MLEGPWIPLAIAGLAVYLVKKYTESTPIALTAGVIAGSGTILLIDNYLSSQHVKKLKASGKWKEGDWV